MHSQILFGRWSQSSKSATIYPLQIQDAGNLSCAFATLGKDVWLRHIIPQIWGTRLSLVGTHSLCPAIFSASSGCAAPPQSHIAPFCPQQSCCGLFCVFRASLPFSASVRLKFPHFKFTEVFYPTSAASFGNMCPATQTCPILKYWNFVTTAGAVQTSSGPR